MGCSPFCGSRRPRWPASGPNSPTTTGAFPAGAPGNDGWTAWRRVLPLLIALLGTWLLRRLAPWPHGGRAVAIDSTPLRARGGVWHKKHREAGEVPHTSIDTEAA
jgi:hypothetical protein